MAIAIKRQIESEARCEKEQSDAVTEMETRMVAEKEEAVRAAVAEASARTAGGQQQVIAALEAKLARTNEALQLALARLHSSPAAAAAPAPSASAENNLTMF